MTFLLLSFTLGGSWQCCPSLSPSPIKVPREPGGSAVSLWQL